MIQIKSQKNQHHMLIKQILDLIYLCILGLYLLHAFFYTTTFVLPWPTWYLESVRIAIGVFLTIKIVVNAGKNIKGFLFDIIFLILFYFIYKGTGYIFLLELGFFVLAAKDISYKKVIRLYLAIGISVMAITILGALTGAVEDIIYVNNDMLKHAFGIVYTTDFAAHIFFLVLAYLFLKEKAPNFFLNIILLFLAYILYRYSGARCSAGCMVLLVLGGLYVKYSERGIIKSNKIKSRWSNIQLKIIRFIDSCLVVTVPIFALIALLFTIYYSPDNSLMSKLDKITSNRLRLGHDALQNYGFSLWGSPFVMIGWGQDLVERVDYNFVDSSYVMIFVRYGLILFSLTILGFLWLAIKTKKTGKRYMMVLLCLMALQSVMEYHLLEIAYNSFVLLIFTNMNSLNQSVCSTVNKKRNKDGVKYCVAIVVTLVIFFNHLRILAYGRTVVTLLNLNNSENNIYFVLAVLAVGMICILTVVMLWNLYLAITVLKNEKLVFRYSIGSAFGLIFFISGLFVCDTIIINESPQYGLTIHAGKMILEQLNQVEEYNVYVDDIPYLYMKDKNIANNIIPGTPYSIDVKNAVVITQASNEMINLIKIGYLSGQISDTEYLYTNNETVANIVRENGIELDNYYAGKQSVDLIKMAGSNLLSVDDNGSLFIEGSSKSLIYGPWATIYKGHILVVYDLELLDTDISEGEVAMLRLTSYYGANILKEIIVNKSDFDKNGHCIAILDCSIPDSVGVEFLLIANSNTKLKLNSLTYEKIGKE